MAAAEASAKDVTPLDGATSDRPSLMRRATSGLRGVIKNIKDTSTAHEILDEALLKNFYLGAIDLGTTSARFLIFDGLGDPVAQEQVEFEQLYPHSG